MRKCHLSWLVAALVLTALVGCLEDKVGGGTSRRAGNKMSVRDGGQDLMDTGIVIMDCKRNTRGVWVRFGTFHEPPYFVGIYPTYDYAEGGYIAEVATTNKTAFIPGDFTSYPVLVKVLLESRLQELGAMYNDGETDSASRFHRQLTQAELDAYTAPAREAPVSDVIKTTHWVSSIGSRPMIYAGSFAIKKSWSITYENITYTASAATTITFKDTPVPSAVPGEENIRYWTRSTVNDNPYDPSSRNEWCMWSDDNYPKYVMYNVGPMYYLKPNVSTNYTMEALAELASNGVQSVEIVYEVPGQTLELVRGTVTSASSIAQPTISIITTPNYGFSLVTNEIHRYEYNRGWELQPMHEPEAGTEMHWMGMNNKSNVSNVVYLPRLLKGVPSEGVQRMTTDWFGQSIIVTNAPTHWETDFGIVDIPPGTNELFRIHVVPVE